MCAVSVCAVIVSYDPGPDIIENVAAVEGQVDHVVVVDNSSSREAAACLLELHARPDCTLIRNLQNLGIAAALNVGVRFALDAGFEWVVLFDQDSRVSAQFIAQMLETFHNAPDRNSIAILAPQYVDRDSGVRGRLMQTRTGEILTTMTSGSMMPVEAIRKLGTFDESLFMDYVDIEFCLRARREGWSIRQSPAILFHSLGHTTYHRMLGLTFGATNHSAARRYYITRNRLRLLARYRRDCDWVWRESKAFLLEIAKILFVEKKKMAKLLAIRAGIRDAIQGKVGKQVDL